MTRMARYVALVMLGVEMTCVVAIEVAKSGYVADWYCWNQAGHRAIDGSQLDVNPETHSVHCLRDVGACRNGGFALLQPKLSGASGYEIAFSLDTTGNAKLLELIGPVNNLYPGPPQEGTSASMFSTFYLTRFLILLTKQQQRLVLQPTPSSFRFGVILTPPKIRM